MPEKQPSTATKPKATSRSKARSKSKSAVDPLLNSVSGLTARQVAKIFRITPPAVYHWAKSGCPRNPDRRYNLPDVISWRLAQAAQGEADVEPGAAPGSPGLERAREAKAKLLELEYGERRRDLLPRREVHEGLERLANALRRAGERVQQKFGAAAGQVLDDALEEFKRESIAHFGVTDGNG